MELFPLLCDGGLCFYYFSFLCVTVTMTFFFLYWCRSTMLCWFQVYQFSSVVELCLILCDPMNRSKPGLPVHQWLTYTYISSCVDKIYLLFSLDKILFTLLIFIKKTSFSKLNIFLSFFHLFYVLTPLHSV